MTDSLQVASAHKPEWQPMDTRPCGSKCLLLTAGGVAVIGIAPRTNRSDNHGYVAWAPLPKKPEWLV